ncbi:MAG TPA: dephospho-CoA kinase [Gemmatimonadota bacterium]|jgi:dephospho-CoA kinase
MPEAGRPRSNVRTVGLTGAAASGKSTVAGIWAEHGVEVVDADELAREVVDADPDLRRRLAAEFGEDVLEPAAAGKTGALRRQELARRAFASPERTAALNRLIHPPLVALFRSRLEAARARAAERASAGLVAVDAALIFEVGMEDLFDVIVLVTAPLESRIARLRARGLEDATIQGLVERQIPDAEKIARADHVLVNDASLDDLRRGALALLARISSSREATRLSGS